MKTNYRKPCGNCPFRKDAPLAHWDPREYTMLRNMERRQDQFGGTVFGCHKDKKLPPEARNLCIGWLMYQRENGVPCISLRLHLLTNPELVKQFEEASSDAPLYETIAELVEANIERDMELHPERYDEEE